MQSSYILEVLPDCVSLDQMTKYINYSLASESSLVHNLSTMDDHGGEAKLARIINQYNKTQSTNENTECNKSTTWCHQILSTARLVCLYPQPGNVVLTMD